MLQNALRLIDEYDMSPTGSLILCAVSGGADSMCLLHFLHTLSRTAGFSVTAAHYNHHLRGAESDRDAAFVEARCREWGISCLVGGGAVAAQASQNGTGIEETARTMRYAFLEQLAEESCAGRIATAHNANDNVETLLFHLTRGCGLQGLAGIPPRRGNIVRPFLTTAREEIEAYLKFHGIAHVEDSSNSDTAFVRNRLRHDVLPILRELNPRLTESVTTTIRTLRADNDYLRARAAALAKHALWVDNDLIIETRHIAEAPNAVAPRVVRRLLEQMADGSVVGSSAHLGAIVELARGDDPSASLYLPCGIVVRRVYRELLFTTDGAALPSFEPVILNQSGETLIPDSPWRVFCRIADVPADSVKNKITFYLKCDMIRGVVCLRPRKAGDTITLPSRGSKTVKKLFIDTKVPRRKREQVPILADEHSVLAVAGFGPSERHLAQPGELALEVTIAPTDR